MNPPVPNHYDLENARQLVGLAADSYNAESVFGCVAVEDKRTDTRAVVCRAGDEDVVVAFRGTRSLRNFVTDVCARRAECREGPREAEVQRGFNGRLIVFTIRCIRRWLNWREGRRGRGCGLRVIVWAGR
jgi:hypothetical protein